ncbi:hypothetical protein M8J75_002970 [Diaphorina citri]|nr:hypothetical protein M8J75_002970 [Diaphorina citri]KAI5743341.1 hypothetical protein M8J77_017076 [Diaphorina citri]
MTLQVSEEKHKDGEEEYEPYQNRNTDHSTTNWETMGHLITGSLGAGMMALPIAFKHVGLSIGIIGTILISSLASYCMHQLLRNIHHIAKNGRVPQIEYAHAMKLSLDKGPNCLKWLSRPSPYIVDFFVGAYQMGICCAAIEFISGTAKQVADFHWKLHFDIRIWMLITGLLISPINQIRNFHRLSPLSALGDLLILGGLSLVYYFIFKDGIPSFENKHWIAPEPIKGFALFFGTVMYSVQTIGVIIALEKNMRTPADYRKPFGVFNMGMVIITLADILIGFWGYVKWGDQTQSTITWNLPPTNLLTECIQLMFAFQCLLSYPLQSFVPYEILWNNYLTARWTKILDHEILWSAVLRAAIPWSTVLIAVSIPFLDLMISIVGAFCLPTVGITFPAIMEICIYYNEDRLSRFVLLKNVCLVTIGIFSCILSTCMCAVTILNQLEK